MSTVPATHADTSAMTEVVDSLRGTVRISGHLTVQGADLLRGTVEILRRGGHRRVLVDLQDVQAADAAGLHVLHDLERALAADGARLLLRPPVEWPRRRSTGSGRSPAPPGRDRPARSPAIQADLVRRGYAARSA